MMRHKNREHSSKFRAVSNHDQAVVSVRYDARIRHVYPDVPHLMHREERLRKSNVLKIVLQKKMVNIFFLRCLIVLNSLVFPSGTIV